MNPQQSLPQTTQDGMSSKKNSGHGGWSLAYENGSKPPETKKRGQKKSSSRANKKRISDSQLKDSRSATNNDRGVEAEAAIKIVFDQKVIVNCPLKTRLTSWKEEGILNLR